MFGRSVLCLLAIFVLSLAPRALRAQDDSPVISQSALGVASELLQPQRVVPLSPPDPIGPRLPAHRLLARHISGNRPRGRNDLLWQGNRHRASSREPRTGRRNRRRHLPSGWRDSRRCSRRSPHHLAMDRVVVERSALSHRRARSLFFIHRANWALRAAWPARWVVFRGCMGPRAFSAQHLSAFRKDPVLGGKSRVAFSDFALAVRRAGEEE